MSGWIPTSERLPPAGQYVLGYRNGDNWLDGDDQDRVNCVVVKRVEGLSLADRERMARGEIPDPGSLGWCLDEGWHTSPRHKCWYSADEGAGNNERPYNWEPFGPISLFGQDIVAWQPIEPYDAEGTAVDAVEFNPAALDKLQDRFNGVLYGHQE